MDDYLSSPSGGDVAEMLLTVAICTLNRAESLRRTLDSLAAMGVPCHLGWEVVVVNNNCTDHTDEVINAFNDRLPIHREFEPQRGHSRARNRAVEAAKGDYIVWTDDDVVVDPGWLAAYAEAFRRWPEAAVFGGRITPRYEMPVVKWVAESEALLGGPFAIRGLGDEVDVIERILGSGAVGYWVPAAQVEHCISHDRQTVSYIERYFAGAGETSTLMGGNREMPLWFGVPRWLWRGLIDGWLRYHLHRRFSPAPVWVNHLRTYAFSRGAIRTLLKMRFELFK